MADRLSLHLAIRNDKPSTCWTVRRLDLFSIDLPLAGSAALNMRIVLLDRSFVAFSFSDLADGAAVGSSPLF